MPLTLAPCALQLKFEARTTEADLLQPDVSAQHWTLPIGLDNLWPMASQRSGPSPLDIENAIQVVEDQIQRLHRHIPPGTQLVMAADRLAPLLRQGGIGRPQGESMTLAGIEQEYQWLAARSMGAPSAAGSRFDDARGDALVLILRECMHHLGFETLRIEG